MEKRKKKALLIALSSVGGAFTTAVFAAAFICSVPESAREEDYDDFAKMGDFFSDDGHVSGYKTGFKNTKAQTSAYTAKYENVIQSAEEKIAKYTATKNQIDAEKTYLFESSSDTYATLFIEDFMDELAKDIDKFFEQIRTDRARVKSDYTIKLKTLKEAYHNNIEALKDDILECEKNIAELDSEDENFAADKERYEQRIEILRVEISDVQTKYDNDVIELDDAYEADLLALANAEEDIKNLKETYALDDVKGNEISYVSYEEEQVIVEEKVEVVEEEINFGSNLLHHASVAREPSSVSIESDVEESVVVKEMVDTIVDINPNLFTFKCFDNCYLYFEPEDKNSYWHF